MKHPHSPVAAPPVNTLDGYLQFTLIDGNACVVRVSDIVSVCQISYAHNKGSRISIPGDALCVQEAYELVISRITLDQRERALAAKIHDVPNLGNANGVTPMCLRKRGGV